MLWCFKVVFINGSQDALRNTKSVRGTIFEWAIVTLSAHKTTWKDKLKGDNANDGCKNIFFKC